LQLEIFYDENDLRIKEKQVINKRDGSFYISTRIYERDKEGNILKITSYGENDVIESIELHDHEKH